MQKIQKPNALILTIFFAVSGLIFSSCSLSASIYSTVPKAATVTQNGYQGLSSGGLAPVTTSGGYRVQSSLGASTQQAVLTTAGGYTIYSSVEGQIVSDTHNGGTF